ncbi:MAG: type II toxin-antitoxin system RelE/ParE family toxin [Thermaerobacter sp.]|nr:type II toxin-antitoxin system RelE/ParE family toxin [Thermaerobacter sp.]
MEEFLATLEYRHRVKMYRVMDYLKTFGPTMGLPHAEHIQEDIWCLRAPAVGRNPLGATAAGRFSLKGVLN